MTIYDKVREVAASVFGISSAEISYDTSPSNTQSWDSLAQMKLILALEEQFEVEFSLQQIEEMKEIRIIVPIIKDLLSQVRTG